MTGIEFPSMRSEVIAALRSLGDPAHQESWWGRYEPAVNYYDDLTLNVHILYDDCQVLPHPETAVPAVIYVGEVPVFQRLEAVLGSLISELGDRPDVDYMGDPRWADVVVAARAALRVVEESDRNRQSDAG